jgi:hypothetical protein
MISVRLKLEELGVNTSLFGEGAIDSMRASVRELAHAAHSEWIRLAQERLHTSRVLYVNALQQRGSFDTHKVDGETVYTLSLLGEMANNVEFGMAPFDMKAVRPGWLGGGKAKVSKTGKKYVTIPFRHPSAASVSRGNPRDFYSGKALKSSVHRDLVKTVKSYGLDRMLRTGNRVIEGPVRRAPNRPEIHPYMRGLTRVQKAKDSFTPTGKQRGSSQLLTWRIMSETSPPDSWLHPGLEAANIRKEVERYVDDEVTKLVERTFS